MLVVPKVESDEVEALLYDFGGGGSEEDVGSGGEVPVPSSSS